MKRTEYILLILLLLAAACDSTGPDDPIDEQEQCVPSIPGVLQPLSTEHSWKYFFYRELLPNPDQPRDTVHISYDEILDVQIAGELMQGYLQTVRYVNRSPNTTQSLFANDAAGLTRLGTVTPDDTLLAKYLNFPYPAQVGDQGALADLRYNSAGELVVEDTLTVKLIAVDEELETPAGIFRTYVYRYLQPPPSDDVASGNFVDAYFAPGIGIVGQIQRAESFDGPGEVKTRFLLSDYCLKEQ